MTNDVEYLFCGLISYFYVFCGVSTHFFSFGSVLLGIVCIEL